MMPPIYLSYRRQDTKAAHRLYDDLTGRFGAGAVFYDVANIPPGVNFQTYLAAQLDQAQVVIVLIGSAWLDSRDADGNRRIDSPVDYVRVELETALAAGKRVIPVLADGMVMPRADDLPASLRPLTERQAIPYTPNAIRALADQLADSISFDEAGIKEDAFAAPAPAASFPIPAPAPLDEVELQTPRRNRWRAILAVLLLIVCAALVALPMLMIQRSTGPNIGDAPTPTQSVVQQTALPPLITTPEAGDDPLSVIGSSGAALAFVAFVLVIVGGLLIAFYLQNRPGRAQRTAFLSYQRSSGIMTVAWLNEGLSKRGVEAFYDGEMTGMAGHFPTRLVSEIEKRDVFVCVLADTTLQSEWVVKEIQQAHALRKPMIPVFLESFRKPDDLPDEAVRVLLENQGEHLLDQRGIHLDYSMHNIAEMIRAYPRGRG
ncbi:MAG: toll/interleukin-1 receptor domain-containing protein [bacterium]|nr:toll/interleukin-1 receptor domain-containing protein [bacterium]